MIKVFENTEFGSVRTVTEGKEVYFVAKDVADILGYSQTSNMIKRLDDEDFIHSKMDGMNMKSILINESGLYSAILGSKLPEAKRFKRWVTSEVLPTIRTHGVYAVEHVLRDPDFLIRTLTALKEEREVIRMQRERLRELKPKALFSDAVSSGRNTILVGELAKLIRQNGIEMGQNRLFKWLRENRYLIRRSGTSYNMPSQQSIDQGLFRIKETAITHADGHVTISKTPKVTGKGQVYFINKFLNSGC